VGPTAGSLQGLTVMQQCVCQIKFWNVCEVKKRLLDPGLVWSRTLSILLSINEKTSPCLCSHSRPTLQAVLVQAVEKWTTEWIVSHSVINVNKICFCTLCNQAIISHWRKKWYFTSCVFSR